MYALQNCVSWVALDVGGIGSLRSYSGLEVEFYENRMDPKPQSFASGSLTILKARTGSWAP